MSKKQSTSFMDGLVPTLESYLVILQHAQSIFFMLGLEHKRKNLCLIYFWKQNAKCMGWHGQLGNMLFLTCSSIKKHIYEVCTLLSVVRVVHIAKSLMIH